MGSFLAYTERAYQKIEQLCHTRYYIAYSKNDGNGAYRQMEKELTYIKQKEIAPLLLTVYEAFTAVEAKKKEYYFSGSEGASVVFYILGLTEIEPTSFIPKVYSEFLYGAEGEEKWNIEVRVAKKLYEKIIKYFDNHIGEARVRFQHNNDGTVRGINVSDPNVNIDLGEDKEFMFRFPVVGAKKNIIDKFTTQKSYIEIQPTSLESKIKCWSWIYGNAWDIAEELLKIRHIDVENFISNREDVFEYLIRYGIDRKAAYKISTDIKSGRINRKGWDKETYTLLNEAGIPKWYLDSCEKITYLGSRVNAIMALKYFGLL